MAQHLTSKEIALRLGISPHTVDQRLRSALRTLNVRRRKDAALLLLRCEAEPQQIFPMPFATDVAGKNNLSIAWRLTWIVFIAFGSALAAGVLIAALNTFVAMLRHKLP